MYWQVDGEVVVLGSKNSNKYNAKSNLSMFKVDSHQHFWDYDAQRHSWITEAMSTIKRDFHPDDLQSLLHRNGFDACVTVQVDQTEEEAHHLSFLADQNDFIAGVVGWIDLRDKDVESRLRNFAPLKKLKGFRHIVQDEGPGFLLQPSFVRGVRKLKDFGFTYDLLLYHNQLSEALAFARQTPDTRIVVDHIAKPSIRTRDIDEWSKLIRALAECDNLYCKVSGMVTEAKWDSWKHQDFRPYLDVIVEAFGTDRLMYGSDWPVCLVAASYDEQLSIVENYFSKFSPGEKDKVFGGNAKLFYNL